MLCQGFIFVYRNQTNFEYSLTILGLRTYPFAGVAVFVKLKYIDWVNHE